MKTILQPCLYIRSSSRKIIHLFFFLAILLSVVVQSQAPQEASEDPGIGYVEERYDTSNWTLVFEDEFLPINGSPHVDWHKWNVDVGYPGGNGEIAYYANRTENLEVVDPGILKINAVNYPYEYRDEQNRRREVGITSGSITSKKGFKYGRIEAHILFPEGKGTWTAFWMLSTMLEVVGWPACGEIDIVENVGYQPNTVHSTLHHDAYNWLRQNDITWHRDLLGMHRTFNTYILEWSPENVSMWFKSFRGDEPAKRVLIYQNDFKCDHATYPFNHFYQIKLNFAVGGSWGGQFGIDWTMFTNTMIVDWVRVYQNNHETDPDRMPFVGSRYVDPETGKESWKADPTVIPDYEATNIREIPASTLRAREETRKNLGIYGHSPGCFHHNYYMVFQALDPSINTTSSIAATSSVSGNSSNASSPLPDEKSVFDVFPGFLEELTRNGTFLELFQIALQNDLSGPSMASLQFEPLHPALVSVSPLFTHKSLVQGASQAEINEFLRSDAIPDRTTYGTALLVNISLAGTAASPKNQTFVAMIEQLARQITAASSSRLKSYFLPNMMSAIDRAQARSDAKDAPISWSVFSFGPSNPWAARTQEILEATQDSPISSNLQHSIPFHGVKDIGLRSVFYFVEYDHGGQNVGHFDITSWNQYMPSLEQAYRSYDGVDIDTMNPFVTKEDRPELIRTTDLDFLQGEKYTVGYLDSREWLRFSGIRIPGDDIHVLALDITYSNGMNEYGKIQVEIDGNVHGNIWTMWPTGSWEGFGETASQYTFTLGPGLHTVRFLFIDPKYRLLSFRIVSLGTLGQESSGDEQEEVDESLTEEQRGILIMLIIVAVIVVVTIVFLYSTSAMKKVRKYSEVPDSEKAQIREKLRDAIYKRTGLGESGQTDTMAQSMSFKNVGPMGASRRRPGGVSNMTKEKRDLAAAMETSLARGEHPDFEQMAFSGQMMPGSTFEPGSPTGRSMRKSVLGPNGEMRSIMVDVNINVQSASTSVLTGASTSNAASPLQSPPRSPRPMSQQSHNNSHNTNIRSWNSGNRVEGGGGGEVDAADPPSGETLNVDGGPPSSLKPSPLAKRAAQFQRKTFSENPTIPNQRPRSIDQY